MNEQQHITMIDGIVRKETTRYNPADLHTLVGYGNQQFIAKNYIDSSNVSHRVEVAVYGITERTFITAVIFDEGVRVEIPIPLYPDAIVKLATKIRGNVGYFISFASNKEEGDKLTTAQQSLAAPFGLEGLTTPTAHKKKGATSLSIITRKGSSMPAKDLDTVNSVLASIIWD